MVTLGDVWAITALIAAIAASAWALLLCMTLLFPTKTRAARDAAETHPLKYLLIGLAWTLVAGGGALVLLNAPQAPIKLAGWMLLLALFGVSFVGTAGLVLLAGERLQQIDPAVTGYGALSRGSLFVVLPCILPILGWFLFAPAILCLGVGAGVKALRRREQPVVVAMEA